MTIIHPISDFLIQIQNGYLARKKNLTVPFSKIIWTIAQLLVKEKYLDKIDLKKENDGKKSIAVELLYKNKKPRINRIEIVSKPARRVYVSVKDIPRVLGGLGISIISTPKGIMTDKQAKKSHVAGELICKIW